MNPLSPPADVARRATQIRTRTAHTERAPTEAANSTLRSPVVLRTFLVAVVGVAALSSCRAIDVPFPTSPAPVGAVLDLAGSSISASESVQVTPSGCDDDFQYVEVRLVVGSGDARRSAAITSTTSGEPVEVTAPAWVPSGPAAVEASCLEPNLSGASDGADVYRFDYAPLAVDVEADPSGGGPGPMTGSDVAANGTLTLSGTGCSDRVVVWVARGSSLVGSRARFNYGATVIDAAADGTWSAEIALDYSFATFTDSVAPGAMTAFAACAGEWYEPFPFAAAGPTPSVHLAGPGPSGLVLSQCPTQNTLSVLGLVELANGDWTYVVLTQPGPGYGESVLYPAVAPGATTVVWLAGCTGTYSPHFSYRSLTWSQP